MKEEAFQEAPQLAFSGSSKYPDNPQLQHYARVLAPPKLIRKNLPSNSSVKANRDWIRKNSMRYRGKWIGLRNGELVGVANSLDELTTKTGPNKDVLITKI